MRAKKCSVDLYVNFLIASPKQYSALELSKVAPAKTSHDAISHWLSSEELDTELVWNKAREWICLTEGYLVIDDSVLDKPYAKRMALVKHQYSGKHHGVVKGINIVNLLWTDGKRRIPIDYRIYAPEVDGKTKNDHARAMLETAKQRGLQPKAVLMDSGYTSLDNLKFIKDCGWHWLGSFKGNRLVSNERGWHIRMSELDWTYKPVQKVWLKGYGTVHVCKIETQHGHIAYVASNDLSLDSLEQIQQCSNHRWTIEVFHRTIKQCCGVERCYSILERSQRNHILCAFLAFLRLEYLRISRAISCYQYKSAIVRFSIHAFLAKA